MPTEPQIEKLRVYPVKSLDGVEVDVADVRANGTLAHDREFALFDANGNVLNAKRDERLHAITADYDPDAGVLTVDTPSATPAQFDLVHDTEAAETWFMDVFDEPVTIRRDTDRGMPDRPKLGLSVVSTATIRTVASWFDELTVEGTRRRLRTNVEVSGVPAFWEDQFVGDDAPAFEVGGLRFEGAIPCGRCVVPGRDPDTGEPLPKFRKRFIEKRRETVPEWVNEDAFDHWFALTTITRLEESTTDGTIRVGDSVTLREE
ncbi:MOSC N-terminal beta barrel domain-containing protein (plasmid) [Haloferax larsenii]|uniref:MOSC N-terminal beta barrel domain-containing protein n=1 Tax=Haloferax larsenii TaxID=302484 RepID=A0ABY5RLC3_HALLR|nr:MOSC N-terminal beta barrel domain-containing protein [Haloferax larsenii]UVE52320.1 MOSC N-terminal beta barrel domain-containing protein [Haloferax larsenii]